MSLHLHVLFVRRRLRFIVLIRKDLNVKPFADEHYKGGTFSSVMFIRPGFTKNQRKLFDFSSLLCCYLQISRNFFKDKDKISAFMTIASLQRLKNDLDFLDSVSAEAHDLEACNLERF